MMQVIVVGPEGHVIAIVEVDGATLVGDLLRVVSPEPNLALFLGWEELDPELPLAIFGVDVLHLTLAHAVWDDQQQLPPPSKRTKLMEQLTNCDPRLTALELSDVSWSECELVSQLLHPGIRSVRMVARDAFGDAGAVAVAPALGHCSLESLDLTRNYICMNGTQAVCDALRTSALSTLTFSQNVIGNRGLSSLLSTFSCLTKLFLSDCGIGPDDVKCFSASRLSTLSHLDLSLNAIGCDGARYLAEWLQRYGAKLMWLDLSENHSIADAGLATLAPAVGSSSVRVLNLCGSVFVNVEPLCVQLEKNHLLMALDISHTRIANAAPIIDLVSRNRNLRVLNIASSDCLPMDECLRLLASLKGVKYFGFDSPCQEGQVDMFRELIERNTALLGWSDDDDGGEWATSIILRNRRYQHVREAIWSFMMLSRSQLEAGGGPILPPEILVHVSHLVWRTRDDDSWQRPYDRSSHHRLDSVSRQFRPVSPWLAAHPSLQFV